MVKKILLRILLLLGLFVLAVVVNFLIFNGMASRVTEGMPVENRDPEGVALLVIDIQGGTTGKESALESLVHQSEMLIERVNRILNEMHAKDQTIIYVRTEVVNPLLNILNSTMARGSGGDELDPRLVILPGEVVVKRRGDPFMGTDLDRILADHQISELVLVGLDAGQCVKSAALAARNRGYRIVVVEDAVISGSDELKAQAIADFREMGVMVLSENELQERY